MKILKMNKQGKIILSGLILVITMVLVMGVAFAGKGHGAPKGKHYTLNILGKAWDDKAPIENCGQGHRIFVNLGQVPTNKQGKSKGKSSMNSITEIYLFESVDDTFQVLDCDGTDGVAAFMLPDPNDPGTDCTRYSVWVRALGGPGGSANMNTCATYTDEETGEVWNICSTEIVGLARTKGKGHKQTFEDVSKQLLTICVPVCVDYNEVTETCEEVEWQRKYIFDDSLEDEYWKYDNNGLRHAQIRFYWEKSCPDATDDWSCPDLGNPY